MLWQYTRYQAQTKSHDDTLYKRTIGMLTDINKVKIKGITGINITVLRGFDSTAQNYRC